MVCLCVVGLGRCTAHLSVMVFLGTSLLCPPCSARREVKRQLSAHCSGAFPMPQAALKLSAKLGRSGIGQQEPGREKKKKKHKSSPPGASFGCPPRGFLRLFPRGTYAALLAAMIVIRPLGTGSEERGEES